MDLESFKDKIRANKTLTAVMTLGSMAVVGLGIYSDFLGVKDHHTKNPSLVVAESPSLVLVPEDPTRRDTSLSSKVLTEKLLPGYHPVVESYCRLKKVELLDVLLRDTDIGPDVKMITGYVKGRHLLESGDFAAALLELQDVLSQNFENIGPHLYADVLFYARRACVNLREPLLRQDDKTEIQSQIDKYTDLILKYSEGLGKLGQNTDFASSRPGLNFGSENDLYSIALGSVDSLSNTSDGVPSNTLLAVGMDYLSSSELGDLAYAPSDAMNVAGRFERLGFKSEILLNNDATSQNIVKGLITNLSKAKPQDSVVLYVAGHGFSDDAGNRYLMTSNGSGDFEVLSLDLIRDVANTSNANVYIIADACFENVEKDNELMRESRARQMPRASFRKSGVRVLDLPSVQDISEDLVSNGNNTMMLLSSSLGESAIESTNLKSGITTYAMLEYLDSVLGSDNDTIDVLGMAGHMKFRTKQLVKAKYGLDQNLTILLD